MLLASASLPAERDLRVHSCMQDALRVNAIGRAVARLTSTRPGIRLAHLAWLEQTCAQREPEHLALQHAQQLQPLVEAARSRQVPLCCLRSLQADASLQQLPIKQSQGMC